MRDRILAAGGSVQSIEEVPRALRDVFKTPAFSGTLLIGGEARFSLDASAEWADPLVLLPDVIEVQAVGDSEAGPSLGITLEQASEEDAPVAWAVNIMGALAIVTLGDLPTLNVEGGAHTSVIEQADEDPDDSDGTADKADDRDPVPV